MEHCAAIWGQDSFLYCFALGFSTAYPFTLRSIGLTQQIQKLLAFALIYL